VAFSGHLLTKLISGLILLL